MKKYLGVAALCAHLFFCVGNDRRVVLQGKPLMAWCTEMLAPAADAGTLKGEAIRHLGMTGDEER